MWLEDTISAVALWLEEANSADAELEPGKTPRVVALESPKPALTPYSSPLPATSVPLPSPIPVPPSPPELVPALLSLPELVLPSPPELVPAPLSLPELVPSAHLRHLPEKRYMLGLINQERRKAGVSPIELGDNHAAQLHADNSLANCFSGHWGIDGLKPYMRYSLMGGYQSNGENGSGSDYCIKASDGYSPLSGARGEIRLRMDSWMDSQGHRRNILDPTHRKVNIGLAWDRYNMMAYQHFEGDYLEYTALPKIEDRILSFEGHVRNGAKFDEGQFIPVAVFYDPPPHSLTRGQAARTYCYDLGRPVAFLRKPPPPDGFYVDDTAPTKYKPCPSPYNVSPGSPGPSSAEQAHELWEDARASSQRIVPIPVVVSDITASEWQVNGGKFSVKADLSGILDDHGPGVYTLLLWGTLDYEAEVVSQYSIFYGIRPPDGYE